MGYTNIGGSINKKTHQVSRKEKSDQATTGYQQYPQQQHTMSKSEKYGSWGPVYKNKQNFIDMHIC